jgi:hypothetical protein
MLGLIVVFLIFVLIFQILAGLTYRYELEWLRTDYVWLVIASFALFFYSAKGDQYEANIELKTEEHFIKQFDALTSNSVSTGILGLEIIDEELRLQGVQSSDSRRVETVESRKRIREILAKTDEIGWGKYMKDYYNPTQLSEGVISDSVKAELSEVTKHIEEIAARHQRVADVRSRTNISNWSGVELILYPYVFAFALALRLGRTTADYRRKIMGSRQTG